MSTPTLPQEESQTAGEILDFTSSDSSVKSLQTNSTHGPGCKVSPERFAGDPGRTGADSKRVEEWNTAESGESQLADSPPLQINDDLINEILAQKDE